MRRTGALWAAAAFLGASNAFGAEGTTSAEFLRFGTGGPSALSDAGGSVETGVTGLYWNPAGLGVTCGPDAYFSHNSLPETLRYDFFGFSWPVGEASVAYGLQSLSQGSIPKLDNTGTRVGDFSAADQAHTIAWGMRQGPRRIGASLRHIRQRLDGEEGGGLAVDLGAQSDFEDWSGGVSLANVGPGYRFNNDRSPLPTTLRAGVGRRLLDRRLFLAGDVSASEGRWTLLHFGARYRPFAAPLTLGAGYTFGEKDEDGPSGLAAGLGLEHGSLRADLAFRPFGVFGNSVQFGVGYRFCPAPDSDGDGVDDSSDRCSGTPAGTAVDRAGCTRDSDADGVHDGADRCPGTPTGSPVDSGGCPLDADSDNVHDGADRCPGTPPGKAVDAAGCLLDADEDGVADAADRCLGTPPGTVVEASGCPPDADGDGVADAADRCPGTPSGTGVDPEGCASDADRDGIADAADLCPGTPPDSKVDAGGCRPVESIQLRIEFPSGKVAVPDSALEEIRKVADFMKAHPKGTAVIHGHTDKTGKEADNLWLSKNRAESVRNFVIKLYGIAPERLTSEGHGSAEPVADNKTPEGRKLNRRVVATFTSPPE